MTYLKAPIAAISLPAEPIILGFPITNTMIAAWLSILVLFLLARAATRGGQMALVPRGIQNLFEFILESLFNFVTSVAGEENGRKFFPLIATIFLFIMTSAWLALLPGFGTIGTVQGPHGGHGVVFEHSGPIAFIPLNAKSVSTGEPAGHGTADTHAPATDTHGATTTDTHGAAPAGHAEAGEHSAAGEHAAVIHNPDGTLTGTLIPFLRSANTDLNTTLAIALVAMFFIEKWGLQALGMGYVGKFLNFKEGPIGVFVGLLEIVSEFSRIVSFTFRLFGNMFAGEVLLAVITFLVPVGAILPFLGLEIFVGFVQALVFAGLTLVFASMAVAGHGEHEEEHGGHGEHEAAPAHAAAHH